MSEDNFDGDSVPSPSAQDVNTSTEAILDMIDEFVDGPGAPKRVSITENIAIVSDTSASTCERLDLKQHSDNTDSENSAPQTLNESADSAKSEIVSDDLNTSKVLTETQSKDDNNSSIVSPQASTSATPVCRSPEPISTSSCTDSVLPAGSALPSVPSTNVQTLHDNSESSDCEHSERTVKCVTSSENRDSVTVESAESTSSDCSVSDKKQTSESSTRSPLRRRLVRPTACDRRPDYTVSSTVDTQPDIITIQEISSENVAKDVSSSSDAVPTVHGNDRPEEIRNVSEISVCKAETSVNPPKKIKLVRQKVIPTVSNSNYLPNVQSVPSENEQCQSTSGYATPSQQEPCTESSSSDSILKLNNDMKLSITEELSVKNETAINDCKDIKVHETDNNDISIEVVSTENVKEDKPVSSLTPSVSATLTSTVNPDSATVDNPVALDEQKKVPPIKLICETSSSEYELQKIEPQSSHPVSPTIHEVSRKVMPIKISIPPTNTELPNCNLSKTDDYGYSSTSSQGEQKKVPPIKLNLNSPGMIESKSDSKSININQQDSCKNNAIDDNHSPKQVPKLTIKLSNKQSDEMKSPVPKVTIKPIRPPVEESTIEDSDNNQQIPSVTKINIKPILKPEAHETPVKPHKESEDNKDITSITKLYIKPLTKPPEKINDTHRKSSSSEISESECSENDESTSTSDQASTSDQGPSDVVPKVTIKLGKPGTDSEGKFYTEQNIPKLTIKGLQHSEKEDHESASKLKLVITQSEEKQLDKIPKLTIKTVATKPEGQPLSPKLTIKPIKPPDTNKDIESAKLKMTTEVDVKENMHVPKITIKPVTKMDADVTRSPKKSSGICDSPEQIPVVTKLNIKPILKPTDISEPPEGLTDKVPVVSKLNIKPVLKPKDNEVDSSIEDVPKIIKLNIKPLKNPEEKSSGEKDCDELNADIEENSIPVVTKLNIKPIVKPLEEESLKDSENQSSETGNSSDDNADHIPVVTKLNIKPIVKPSDEDRLTTPSEQSIPVITKLNIKPLVKPEESASPSSPKKENLKSSSKPVTKINIKPVVKPEDNELQKLSEDSCEKAVKNPPIVMKINMKTMTDISNAEPSHSENICNNLNDNRHHDSPINFTPCSKLSITSSSSSSSSRLLQICPDYLETANVSNLKPDSQNEINLPSENMPKQNCVVQSVDETHSTKPSESNIEQKTLKCDSEEKKNDSVKEILQKTEPSSEPTLKTVELHQENDIQKSVKTCHSLTEMALIQQVRTKISSIQNCTLLKKLLENTKDSMEKINCDESKVNISNCTVPSQKHESTSANYNDISNYEKKNIEDVESNKISSEHKTDYVKEKSSKDKGEDNLSPKSWSNLIAKDVFTENITKPLEINTSEKATNQGSGQDSPRIILKINKTDHGASAKIITEESSISTDPIQESNNENTQEVVNDRQSPKKQIFNSRRKNTADAAAGLTLGKRLRSSRIVENSEKSPIVKRNTTKRPSTTEPSPPPHKEPEMSLLESKRLKLGQLLSVNKSLTITPVSKVSQTSPTKNPLEINKHSPKTVNHSLINNENCSKNGNSKLHNILSNLQAKQMQTLSFNESNNSEKARSAITEIESNASSGSADMAEISRIENCHPEVQEMLINENSDFRDFNTPVEEMSQDPLEVDTTKPVPEETTVIDIPKVVEMTPQPKKRGRPRKLPVSEGAKPVAVTLPIPALEERPQRSLRLTRDRPAILAKPRGRGRGRGARRVDASPNLDRTETVIVVENAEDDSPGTIDPTSSRIKLPRMTEALDKMPGVCNTPLSSRRRSSGSTDAKTFSDSTELRVVLDGNVDDSFMKSPEAGGSVRGRGRGSRGGRGRTPRGRGRGRGGGRGAMYMKETLGIYGRVCGPATTTVQLFEEETCMMDDNATPAKPSHLLDEDSQSSVKSSTNESNKFKKSKFADLFDSNKVWTAADVKEYTWPPPEKSDVEHQVMMIQEQVAMFLSVKSFKRRYPELKRRTIVGEERDYVLSKGLVTEALCDLGITAVDASEVLDIMLSDYPHKYEEYRSHQRERQLNETVEEPVEVKHDEKPVKTETKETKATEKPEAPKVDPEKTRQDMAAAAIASASEWNARMNALRRPACADLQSLTVLRRRAAPAAPPPEHVRPPHGFYPHALLPGQYQHTYRLYTPDQLRYFPLNTVLAAPPAPPSPVESSSESEGEWGSRSSSSEDSDAPHNHNAKRKKLTKVKRSSQTDGASTTKEEPRVVEGEVDLCRVCKLRLEANRKHTHERFLVCSNCNAKLHPGCVELSADTIRKCREYAWQCAECKTCAACSRPADDDKMLFCDLCDRGFHIYCVGLDTVPTGRWHCVECAVCKSCGARDPHGPSGTPEAAGEGPAPPADWHHQTKRGPGGHKMYSHSLCTPCASKTKRGYNKA